jgi:DnaJ-class molecular chaperone
MGDDEKDETRDNPTCLVACPTCEGTGQQLPADGRPCVMCDGSGLVTADAAKTIVESEEMEVDPPGDG